MNVVLRGNLIVLLLAMPVENLSSSSFFAFAESAMAMSPAMARIKAAIRRMKSKSPSFLSMNKPMKAASARWISILPVEESVSCFIAFSLI